MIVFLRIIFTLLMTVLMAACAPSYVDYFPYHEDGRPKPKVVLLPLVDDTDGCVGWNIASELNAGLGCQIIYSGQLYLIPEDEVAARLQGNCQQNYFTSDLAFAQRFCGSDYVVALELIEHEIIPFQRGMNLWIVPKQKYHWRSFLQTKLRLRIIDVRCNAPRVVLQEIFTSYFAIPTEKECVDYSRCYWGTESFPSTPLGRAHQQLVSELVYRIETVIRGP